MEKVIEQAEAIERNQRRVECVNESVISLAKVSKIYRVKQLIKYHIKNDSYRFFKRAFDIGVGLIGTMLLLPIMGVVKLANLKNGDHAPVLLKQNRIGKNGKTICIYKIRSMVPNAEEVLEELMRENPEIRKEYLKNKKLENDPRITKVGAFIRKTSLDEFRTICQHT